MSSNANDNFLALSQKEKDNIINDVMRYCLFMEIKKVPIKKQDISNLILKIHSKCSLIMNLVNEKLEKTIGMKLVDAGSKIKSFILVNTLEKKVHFKSDDNTKHCLLFICLTIIFMNNDEFPEEELIDMLEKMGFHGMDVENSYGMLRRYLKETLGQQAYLKYSLNADVEPPTRMVRWGRRADLEVDREQLLNWVAEVTDVQPEQYTTHYERAAEWRRQREEEREHAKNSTRRRN